jgi:hypothetical protein
MLACFWEKDFFEFDRWVIIRILMVRTLLIIGIAMALATEISAEALPQESPTLSTKDIPASQFEFSPAAGMMGGSALIGLRLSMNYHPVTLELATDQVMGRTATLFPVTLNAILELADSKRTIPYGIVGGGLFLTVPINSVGDETISSVGLNFGGGLRYYITPRIGIRFETKQLFTRIDNRADHRKELLIFQSSTLGVIIAFG